MAITDSTLQADTLALYDELTTRMGQPAFGQWLVMEYPWLEKPTTPLIRVWWVLSNKLNPGQLVIDCCTGSGTFGVAALELGRRFIGIERDPVYYEIATRRLAEAAMQPPLFTDAPARVEARQGALFTKETK